MNSSTKETDARILIDDQLRQAGWDPADKSQVRTSVTIPKASSRVEESTRAYTAEQTDPSPPIPDGEADYPEKASGQVVLYRQDGRPLAVLEAKRLAIHPYTAKQQALPYAKQLGAPFIFLSNGELIYFWDYTNDDARIVNSFFSRRDLERRVDTRQDQKVLATIPIPQHYIRQGEARDVRPYQQEGMRALDHAVELSKPRFCGKRHFARLLDFPLSGLFLKAERSPVIFCENRYVETNYEPDLHNNYLNLIRMPSVDSRTQHF